LKISSHVIHVPQGVSPPAQFVCVPPRTAKEETRPPVRVDHELRVAAAHRGVGS
jgi:hypothetical protein